MRDEHDIKCPHCGHGITIRAYVDEPSVDVDVVDSADTKAKQQADFHAELKPYTGPSPIGGMLEGYEWHKFEWRGETWYTCGHYAMRELPMDAQESHCLEGEALSRCTVMLEAVLEHALPAYPEKQNAACVVMSCGSMFTHNGIAFPQLLWPGGEFMTSKVNADCIAYTYRQGGILRCIGMGLRIS